MMENISTHISYREAVFSPTAIDKGINNEPDETHLTAMRIVANACFELARDHFGPIKVNSFYRCPALNEAVKGSPTSQHMKGEAIDMDRGSREKNKELFDWCKANIKYDQLIWEFGDATGPDLVHISFSRNGNRNQTIHITK